MSKKSRNATPRRRVSISKTWQNIGLGALVAAAAVMGFVALQPSAPSASTAPVAQEGEPKPSATASPSMSAPRSYDSVFFAGDSLTVGWHATTEAKGYRQIVAGKLKTAGTSEISVAAKAGDTLQEVADGFPVPKEFDLAVIELGTNDAAEKADPKVFREQYGKYLDRVQEASPDANIFCLGVWYQQELSITASLDKAISSECKDRGGEFVRLSGLFNKEANRGPSGVETWAGNSDLFHPNNKGHAALADLVYAKISQAN